MPKKSKIILIGGVPGVGKTSLSGAIASSYGINIVLSGDYLREFLRAYQDKNNNALGYSVYDAWKYLGNMTVDNIIKGYKEQAKFIWKGLRAVIDRGIKNGESMVIETLYFEPDYFSDIAKDLILPVYIYISDRKIHEQRLGEREEFTHPGSSGKRLIEHLYEYRTIMDSSIEESRANNIAMIDNISYENTKEKLMKMVADFTGS